MSEYKMKLKNSGALIQLMKPSTSFKLTETPKEFCTDQPKVIGFYPDTILKTLKHGRKISNKPNKKSRGDYIPSVKIYAPCFIPDNLEILTARIVLALF
jgi:hypothetical protein